MSSDFGAALAAARTELEGHALTRMRGTCVIGRPTGDQDTDPDGVVTAVYETIYEGRCYVRTPGLAQESAREINGGTVVEARVIVRVPFGVRYLPGDRVRILTDLDNPTLVGDQYRVESVDKQSMGTAQRLLCTNAQTGEL